MKWKFSGYNFLMPISFSPWYPEVPGNARVCLAGTLGIAGCVKVSLAPKDIAVFSWSLHRKAQGGHEEKQLFPSMK